jgi:hypothetical protein
VQQGRCEVATHALAKGELTHRGVDKLVQPEYRAFWSTRIS